MRTPKRGYAQRTIDENFAIERRNFMKVTISDSIKYIGVDDRDIDLFESQYVVPDGVTYNSYLILDEKTALMDTVDARKMTEWEQIGRAHV